MTKSQTKKQNADILKAYRLPRTVIEQIEKKKRSGDSATDVVVRCLEFALERYNEVLDEYNKRILNQATPLVSKAVAGDRQATKDLQKLLKKGRS